MIVKMLKNKAAYDEGETYELPDEVCEKFIADGSAEKIADSEKPEKAGKKK